jgi:hypothetical protein
LRSSHDKGESTPDHESQGIMVDGAVSATKEEWKSSTGSHGSLSTGSKYKTTWINSPTSHCLTVCEASNAHVTCPYSESAHIRRNKEQKVRQIFRAEQRSVFHKRPRARQQQGTIRENSCSLESSTGVHARCRFRKTRSRKVYQSCGEDEIKGRSVECTNKSAGM